MKQQLRVNVALLIEWQAFCEEEEPRKWLAAKCGCSKSYLNQVFSGVVPGKIMRLRMSRATGINEAELFPVYEAVKASA